MPGIRHAVRSLRRAPGFAATAVVAPGASLLFQMKPLDLPTYVGAVGVLALAVVFAAWLPARRAGRVAPMEALRAE